MRYENEYYGEWRSQIVPNFGLRATPRCEFFAMSQKAHKGFAKVSFTMQINDVAAHGTYRMNGWMAGGSVPVQPRLICSRRFEGVE